MAGSGRQSARSRIKLYTDANEDRTTLRNPKLRKHRSKNHSLIRLLNVDLKVLLGFGIITFLIVIFMIHRLIIAVKHPQKPRVVTPFLDPKIMDLS
ncbi:Mannosyl-oligosaccharide glucosidase GCS1 [Camellia lanceoleosa]|nr:Mannosyl-oligosaccharide glucosidase GCS1 [Camellia lanceoleosa]